MSVGTERSFIGAALSGANALFVIDYDPLTIRFANINRALLAASTDRADYLNLRLSASPNFGCNDPGAWPPRIRNALQPGLLDLLGQESSKKPNRMG